MAVSVCDHFSVPCQGYSESSYPRFVGALETLNPKPIFFDPCPATVLRRLLPSVILGNDTALLWTNGSFPEGSGFIRQSVNTSKCLVP